MIGAVWKLIAIQALFLHEIVYKTVVVGYLLTVFVW